MLLHGAFMFKVDSECNRKHRTLGETWLLENCVVIKKKNV